MSFETYSVAVKLSLINHVSSGLMLISKNLHSTGQDVDLLNSKLMSIGKQASLGVGMFAGGLGIANLFKGPLTDVIKYQTETAKLYQQGLGTAQVADALKFSEANKIIGTSLLDRVKMFTDAQGSFRESGLGGFEALAAAKVMAPVMAKYQVASGLLADGSQGMAHAQFMNLNKTVELMGGLTDAAKAAQITDGVFKTVQSSGRMVSERDLKMFMSYGGVSVAALTPKTIFAGLEPIIGALGGSGVATGLMTAYSRTHGMQALTPSIMTNEALRLGIWDADKVTRTKGGGARFLHGSPMAPELAKLMDTDTIGFSQKMMEIYTRNGITALTDMGRENNILFGRTGGKIYTQIMQQMPVLLHSEQAYDKAQGIDQVIETNKKSPMMATLAMSKAMDDLGLAIGKNVLPTFIPMVNGLTSMAQELGKHPVLLKKVTYAFVGLSAVLVGGGLVNMIGASARGFGLLYSFLGAGGGVAGMAVKGISMIGSALMFGLRAIPIVGWVVMAVGVGVYLYRNWDSIWAKTKEIWSKVSPYIVGTFRWIGDTASSIWSGIKTGFKVFVGFFLDQWQFLFNSIIKGVNMILPSSMALNKLTFGDKWNAPDAANGGGQRLVAPVPPRTSLIAQLTQPIHLDGKKIAEVVTGIQAKEMSKPQTSSQGFDLQRSPIMPGSSSLVYPRG